MNRDMEDIGRQLGEDGTKSFLGKVDQYCAQAGSLIALENRAPILAAKAELMFLTEEERRLRQALRDAPPPGDVNHLRSKKILAWIVTVILTVTGFFLTALTFEPFEFGWKGYLFCVGIATVVPFLIEKLLEGGRMDGLVKALTGFAVVAGIASLILLADVRGRILAHSIQRSDVVSIDGTSTNTVPSDDFYAKTLDPLRFATIFLSLAMELGAGLALREAMAKAPHDPMIWQRLRSDLQVIRVRMILVVAQITALETEPAIFEARFWKDFYRSMLTQAMSSAMRKLLMGILALSLIGRAHGATPPVHTEMVIAVDLTKSVDVKGPDGTTEFQKNIDAVAGVLRQVTPDTRVTIVGITDRSFAQPYILLTATVPSGQDYFGTEPTSARQKLVAAWRQRCVALRPIYSHTDILGALRLAGEIFADRNLPEDRRVLILFSDMRQHTREMDLETGAGIVRAEQNTRMPQPLPHLPGVNVYVLGVDGAGESINQWLERKILWTKYLQTAGVSEIKYMTIRDAAVFRH